MNSFSFVGYIYEDCKSFYNNSNTLTTTFKISIKDAIHKDKRFCITITAYASVAEKCFLICKTGNVIGVEGVVVANERYENNKFFTDIIFVANDVMLISKINKIRIETKKYSDIMTLFNIGEKNNEIRIR